MPSGAAEHRAMSGRRPMKSWMCYIDRHATGRVRQQMALDAVGMHHIGPHFLDEDSRSRRGRPTRPAQPATRRPASSRDSSSPYSPRAGRPLSPIAPMDAR